MNRTITRKLDARTLRRQLVIQIEPYGVIKLREKGARRWYAVELESLYKQLVAIAVREERKFKKKRGR